MQAGALVPCPPDLEPGAPPPLTLPEEPQYAPPPGVGEASLFEAEASSCTHFTIPVLTLALFSFDQGALLSYIAGFEQKFSLTIFGKRLSSEAARILLLGSGATIIVLLVVISNMASTGPDAHAATTVPSPLQSADPSFRPPPPPSSLPVRGCTQPSAQNYDSTATTNDGSCRYPPASLPARHPPPPCVDDGSCDDLIPVLGCTHDLHGSNPQIPPGVVRMLLMPVCIFCANLLLHV